ncbi:NERD domain-containing protein [Methanobrevibacter filiformis]|uniref:Protein SprT-like protein n=1 Tax=Methanobrevibacter filiformis TaxID=55758 RepID=A0A165YU77_9EURY|nr:NERD domain-containing protein [Methanobrevibacter filiformis]KZX09872.1 protein SprT-like protein [Methanobrevibacter filiformis]
MKIVSCENCGARYQLENNESTNDYECSVCSGKLIEEKQAIGGNSTEVMSEKKHNQSNTVYCQSCKMKFALNSNDNISDFECSNCGGELTYLNPIVGNSKISNYSNNYGDDIVYDDIDSFRDSDSFDENEGGIDTVESNSLQNSINSSSISPDKIIESSEKIQESKALASIKNKFMSDFGKDKPIIKFNDSNTEDIPLDADLDNEPNEDLGNLDNLETTTNVASVDMGNTQSNVKVVPSTIDESISKNDSLGIDDSKLKEESTIKDSSKFKNESIAKENSKLKEESVVKEDSKLKEESTIKDSSKFKDESIAKEDSKFKDESIAKEDSKFKEESAFGDGSNLKDDPVSLNEVKSSSAVDVVVENDKLVSPDNITKKQDISNPHTKKSSTHNLFLGSGVIIILIGLSDFLVTLRIYGIVFAFIGMFAIGFGLVLNKNRDDGEDKGKLFKQDLMVLPKKFNLFYSTDFPGSSNTIDHIIVGPSGIFSILTKNVTDKEINIIKQGIKTPVPDSPDKMTINIHSLDDVDEEEENNNKQGFSVFSKNEDLYFERDGKIKNRAIDLSDDLADFLENNDLDGDSTEPLVAYINSNSSIINMTIYDEDYYSKTFLNAVGKGDRILDENMINKISVLLAQYSVEYSS